MSHVNCTSWSATSSVTRIATGNFVRSLLANDSSP